MEEGPQRTREDTRVFAKSKLHSSRRHCGFPSEGKQAPQWEKPPGQSVQHPDCRHREGGTGITSRASSNYLLVTTIRVVLREVALLLVAAWREEFSVSPDPADHGGIYPEPQSALEGSETTHPTCLRLGRRACTGAPNQNGQHSISLWIPVACDGDFMVLTIPIMNMNL